VEEGLAHGVPTQTQGCQPLVINPNGNLTINYLDTLASRLQSRSFAQSGILPQKQYSGR